MASAGERQLKRLGLFGLSRLATRPGPAPTDSDLKSVRRILVVRPDERIGNAILIIPLLNAVKMRFPDAQLSLVIARRYWDLCEFIPSVDEFVPFDKRHYARNPVSFVGFIRRLRRHQYDLVFDASGDHSVSFTHLAITACSGGRFRVGHDRGDARRFYEVPVPVATGPRHETERHLDLLRAVAHCNADARPLLRTIPDSNSSISLWNRPGWRTDRPTIIIHPGARGRKRWPAACFAQVAANLQRNGNQVGVVWGPADTEAAHEMLNQTPDSVKPIGILSFRDFVALIRASDVFVSADCGPMHLAAASPPRRGVVAIFTAARSARYGPLGPNDTAILDDPAHSSIERVISRITALTASHGSAATIRSALA